MTEAEWLTGENPRRMLEWLAQRWYRRVARWTGLAAAPSLRRKLWLFAAACCVRSTQDFHIPPGDRELYNLVMLGQGGIEIQEFESMLHQGDPGAQVQVETRVMWRAESAGKHRAIQVVREELEATAAAEGKTPEHWTWGNVVDYWPVERKAQSDLLRDILGNPFRPVTIHARSWRSSTALQIAKAIYDDRAFDRLPILADALEDAGCDHADVLNHCRQPGEHVRGCWVVDLVLGKS